jgi:hypothetical protein
MDFEQAKQDVLDWVINFVEQPNDKLNGWAPCPHARKARIDGQFDIRPGIIDPYTDLQRAEMDQFMVIAFIYDPGTISAERFNQQVSAVNQGFLLARDIIALADHPDDCEEINGVRMNQGKYAITFIQPLSKLNEFARLIAPKGYYDGWPEEYLTVLFEGREDPRKP